MKSWKAVPLTNATKAEHFQQTRSLYGTRVLLERRRVIASGVLFASGCMLFLASAVIVAATLPMHTTEHVLWLADQSTGVINRPVSLADAAANMGEANDRKALKDYIVARRAWVWETDQARDRIAKIMSTPEEDARIAFERKQPTYIGAELGKTGHVVLENFRFHRNPDGRAHTRSYTVQYFATKWHGTEHDAPVPYTATVSFQWHPELPMLPEDRDDNPGGVQVLAFSATSDIPETVRK